MNWHIINKFSDEMVHVHKKDPNTIWQDFLTETSKTGFSWEQIDAINLTLLSSWLQDLISSKAPPNTVSVRFYSFRVAAQEFSAQLIFQLYSDQIADFIASRPNALSSKLLLLDTLRCFYGFVSRLGITVSSVHWWILPHRGTMHEQPLISQSTVLQVAEALLAGAQLDKYSIVVALLLGFYFGLRISEIINLKIVNVQISSRPTIFVYNSKRNKSRVVEGVGVPQSVLDFLREYKTGRLEKSGGKHPTLLLVSSAGKPLKAKRLNNIIARELQNFGAAVTIGGKHSATHLLRHACANRWLALGIPLIDIAHRLGHQSVLTTVTTYLHIAPFLQREFMIGFSNGPVTFTTLEISTLAGVCERRIKQIITKQELSGLDLNSVTALLNQIFSQ